MSEPLDVACIVLTMGDRPEALRRALDSVREQTVPVDRRGFGALLKWARSVDERIWALEDCRHVSGSLERFLIERGPVVEHYDVD